MTPTLDDLARLSGVSRATVSRVINGGSVSPATRQRVLDVIESTGYRPNLAARSLASGKSGVVGVVMHVETPVVFSDAYFSGLLGGICNSLTDQASAMMLWLGDRTKEETLDHILSITLDGIIVTADTVDDPLVDGLRASGVPSVLVGHRRADRNASYVDIDNVSSAETITDHLIAQGRRRIGHISGPTDSVSAKDRVIGYKKAMSRAGLSPDGLVATGNYELESGREGVAQLTAAGVDAIFCASDYMALGAMRAVTEAGLRVPEDVAIAGFDDLDFAAKLHPPLTTMRQDISSIGYEAARTLGRLLADPSGGPRRILLPTELVVRQSTVRGGGERETTSPVDPDPVATEGKPPVMTT